MEPATVDPRPATSRRLTRSREDRVLGGVCGGLARYLDTDAALIRLAAVVLALVAGTGLLAYLLAWIMLPEEEPTAPSAAAPDPSASRGAASDAGGSVRHGTTILGVVLIAAGTLLLLDRLVPFLSWRYLGPVVLVALGALLLLRGGERS